MMVVAVAANDAVVTVDAPQVLFHGQFQSDHRDETSYDVSPDDKRFMMVETRGSAPTAITVVEHWTTELAARFSGSR